MTKDLLSIFNPNTDTEWFNKITSDLKGKTIESLYWESEIGPINPVLFDSEEVTSDNFRQKESNSWNIRRRFDASLNCANEEILSALKVGVDSIEISNLSANNINTIFNEVMLDIIHVYIDINTKEPKITIDTFHQYCIKKNIDTHNLRGGFLYDPIGNVAFSGNWFKDQNKDFSAISEVLLAASNFNAFSILTISSSPK